MEASLGRCVASWCPGATGVTGAVRLSGGASQETWSFDIVHPAGNIGAILRRAPQGHGASPRAVGLNAEAVLMRLAYDAGVPSPRVLHVLEPQDELGTGFIMQRVDGETIARKILRDDRYAQARPKLARQLGNVLAVIHGLPLPQLPELRRMTAAKEIAEFERDYHSFGWPRPVFELALQKDRARVRGHVRRRYLAGMCRATRATAARLLRRFSSSAVSRSIWSTRLLVHPIAVAMSRRLRLLLRASAAMRSCCARPATEGSARQPEAGWMAHWALGLRGYRCS